MKNLIKMIAAGMLVLSVSAHAQKNVTTDTIVICALASEKQVFTSIALVRYQQRTQLEFKVRKVENIRSYRIEAGNDSAQLTLLGNVVPACSSVKPSSFAFALNGSSGDYRFYRVLQVSMGHEWTASPLLIQSSLKTNYEGNTGDAHRNKADESVCLKP